MQPYFFPYMGYFQLMNCVDKWVVFDQIQFINKGWVNRNRILHPDKDKVWQYFTLPLSGKKQKDYISDISICPNVKRWKETITGKLSFYKRHAPFYNQTMDLVIDCLSYHELNLSKFLTNSLLNISKYLDINTIVEVQSKLKLPNLDIKHPGQWALRIAENLNASEYVNPINGSHLFDPKEFEEKNIILSFFECKTKEYFQYGRKFTPNLSIIDTLMWQPIDEIKSVIHSSVV